MKYKKIKNKLITNYDWSTEIDEHHKEMIMDVNEIVSNHYQQIIDDINFDVLVRDIGAEALYNQLNQKITQLNLELLSQEIETKELRNLALKYDQTNADLRKELADKEKVYQTSIDIISAQLKHEIGRGKLIQSFFDKTSPIHKI